MDNTGRANCELMELYVSDFQKYRTNLKDSNHSSILSAPARTVASVFGLFGAEFRFCSSMKCTITAFFLKMVRIYGWS